MAIVAVPRSTTATTATCTNGWFLFLFYVLCGALHELSHVAVARFCYDDDDDAGLVSDANDWYWKWSTILLGRRTDFDRPPPALVRHAGWIFSLLLVYGTTRLYGRGSAMTRVAMVTAMEALWSDLLQLPVLSVLSPATVSASSFCLYCGNFGILLIAPPPSWGEGQQQQQCFWTMADALAVLERMIEVTMLRGAQSGGLVTFPRGIRSRVVNRKRTDLAKLLVQQIDWDNQSFWTMPDMPVSFCGHTRFATSSKSDLAGTHPHRWSRPHMTWRVFDLELNRFGGRTVDNYVSHNGDFDFYILHGISYPLTTVQAWLEKVTHCPMPAVVDSCAIAGVVDVLRCRGSFGLSARYAAAVGLPAAVMAHDEHNDGQHAFPDAAFFESLGRVFEDEFMELLQSNSFEKVERQAVLRKSLARSVASNISNRLLQQLYQCQILAEDELSCDLQSFCAITVDAFFDNDLFWTTQTFLQSAKGSFGLCFNSTLDADHQLCLAARGQTISIAFYPDKGIVCFGSEQAAVKAALTVGPTLSGGSSNKKDPAALTKSSSDEEVLRLDLDDLGGEVICLDWGRHPRPVSMPNHHLTVHPLMNGGCRAILYQEGQATSSMMSHTDLYHRMTRLTGNPFIKPLKPASTDPILDDIRDMPRVMKAIQNDFDSELASTSMNRLSAYTLSRSLRARLEERVNGTARANSVDIVLTGCEVSLWLVEQFASDLQKCFPSLRIAAVSSNKLLGLYGQELSVPAVGFYHSPKTCDLHDAIVIIVSNSGGTFAPLCCSNLLQSTTKNIFVVTSEWDTQIGRQLRAMEEMDSKDHDHIFKCRIFSTGVGMRPAEPCSVSVVATHQLLTNLLEYISAVILGDDRFRHVAGAIISEQDIQILEKCNRENIAAIGRIVGCDAYGNTRQTTSIRVEKELRQMGDVWSEHVLENAKAYFMSFLYVFGTVISGYAMVSSLAKVFGVYDIAPYAFHTLDAMIYFWLPQINISLLRLVQGRNLLHRMVGRTVVIGDVPWVAQCADAFLSKIFACSYSIAGINVLHGNPVDHLVHRHTHRVVRGTLLVVGRPDGRLSALSTAEAAVCLSVNQASSIQSWGGTCESVTIGHNHFQLPLSAKGIFLDRRRPLFLCERMLVESDAAKEERQESSLLIQPPPPPESSSASVILERVRESLPFRKPWEMTLSRHRDVDCSIRPRVHLRRSAAALLGAYTDFAQEPEQSDDCLTVAATVKAAIKERHWSDKARKLFEAFDQDEDGFLTEEEFVEGAKRLQTSMNEFEVRDLFKLAKGSGYIDYDEFVQILDSSKMKTAIRLPPSHRDERGHIQIVPSQEKYFGEALRKYNSGKSGNDMDFMVARSQEFAMQLYESRIASLQRFVSMIVMFHQMGKRVQTFFQRYSCGMLGYRMDRTHSIMRIATTASPVSGADVKHQMRQLQLLKKVRHSIHVISMAFLRYKARKEKAHLALMEQSFRSSSSSMRLDRSYRGLLFGKSSAPSKSNHRRSNNGSSNHHNGSSNHHHHNGSSRSIRSTTQTSATQNDNSSSDNTTSQLLEEENVIEFFAAPPGGGCGSLDAFAMAMMSDSEHSN